MTLVNREQELAALAALVREVRTGEAGIVLVEGPVGIGKSQLLRRLLSDARRGGTRVLEARCDALERDFPFGVVRQLFEPLFSSLDEPERAALLDGTARAAVRALGALALQGDVVTGTEDVSYAVLHGLYWFTSNLAERSPLVIVVDDAHCADLASLRFLAHLARRIEGLPVLLALSVRTGDEATDAALMDELAAQPLCQVLRPRPLDLDGIAHLVKSTSSQDADERFCSACLVNTGGNPLLVHALLNLLQYRGEPPTFEGLERATAGGGAFYEEAVLCILHQQPEAAVAAARALAVLGAGSPPEVCARLAGLSEPALASAVQALRSIGLVTAMEDGWTWSFNHGLIREVIVADMPPAEREEAHRRAARLLLDSGARAEQVAGHLMMTELPTTEDWAVAVLREAAREASARGAPVLAVDLMRQALREPPESATDVAVLVELGLTEAAVDVHASVRHLRLALDHVTEPAQRFSALTSLSNGLVRTNRSLQAIELLAEQTPKFGDSGADFARLLEAQRLLACCEDLESFRLMRGEPRGGTELAGETPGERALLAARAGIDVVREEHAAAAAVAARRMLERSVTGVDAPAFLVSGATVLLYADRPDEAGAAYQRIIDSTRKSHNLVSYGLSTAVWAEAAYRLGALPDAVAATRTVLTVASPEQWGRMLALPVSTRIHALLDLGDLAGADAAAATLDYPRNCTDSWQWSVFLCARGRLRLALGQPQAALADLLESGRRQHEWSRTSPAVSSWWYWAGRAHLALQSPAPARALAEEAVARARTGGLQGALGAGLRLLAQTESAEGKRLTLLQESLATLEESPARLELARVLVDYGSALHASGRGEAARDILRRGLDLSHALGAGALRSRAYDELLATGARPRRVTSSGLDSLTPSERQVAQLAVEGGTNKEIAEAVFVTQRTVELHLTSVYRKLGVSGRRELKRVFTIPDMEPDEVFRP